MKTLQQIIDKGRRIVFFGGAGVSTESGIPDFRGSDGLFFHPYLQGEITPYRDDKLRASFVGATGHHTKAHFNRAVLEGISYSMKDCYQTLKQLGIAPSSAVLIGGGFDKKSSYDEWIEAFDGKVKYLVLLGQTAEKIAECARSHGFNDIVMASDMDEAVKRAYELADDGEAVLLSPACASWGMFTNFEERGKIFKDLVNKLED